MPKNSFIFNFKNFPKGFLIAFALILFFEGVSLFVFKNYYFVDKFENPAEKDEGILTMVKNEISQIPENNFDILVFGDSHLNMGIIPDIIQSNTGMQCFNFSTNGRNSVFNSYCMFKNYLTVNSKKPKYLIIGFLPSTYKITSVEPAYLYEFTNGNFRTFIEDIGIVQTLKCLVPSLRSQPFFHKIIKRPHLLLSMRHYDSVKLYKEIKDVSLTYGGSLAKNDTEHIKDFIFEESLKHQSFTISSLSRKYVGNILSLAHKNKVKVIYLIPAHPLYIYQALEENGYIKEQNDFIFSLKKEYPNLVIVDSQNFLYENNMYFDSWHLNKKGARIFSNTVSGKINSITADLVCGVLHK